MAPAETLTRELAARAPRIADSAPQDRTQDRLAGREALLTPIPIRILIVDDHEIVRAGVRQYLYADRAFDIVGEAEDGLAAAARAAELRPDVILMDLRMPRLDGIGATARIRAEVPTAEIVALTAMNEPSWVVGAVRAGAVGFLGKNVGDAELATAIRRARDGQVHLTPNAASILMREMRSLQVPDALSEREMAVLKLVGRGMTNQQIAESLRIGSRTVRSHVGHIMLKLGVESRGDVAVRAIHLGVLPLQATARAG